MVLHTHRTADSQTDSLTDRQTGIQTGRHTDRQTDRHTDNQTDGAADRPCDKLRVGQIVRHKHDQTVRHIQSLTLIKHNKYNSIQYK